MAYEAGILGPFGPALFAENGPANLISWVIAKENGFSRAFDEESDTFRLSRGHERYEFTLNNNYKNSKLYTLPFPRTIAAPAQVINDQIFTTTEIARAKAARDVHVKLDHISDTNLIDLINGGGLTNSTVSAVDVRNAAKALGPCIHCIQGKMTEPSARTSTSPPSAEIAETLHMDLFFAYDGTSTRKSPFLISIEGRYNHMVVSKLSSKNTATLTVAMQEVVNIYRSYGHNVKFIRPDSEKNFLAAIPVMNSMGIQVMPSTPGQHSHRAERGIRTLRTRMRAMLQGLTYKLPRLLYPTLILNLVSSLNMTPNTHSAPLSPRELVTGMKVDANALLRAKYGDFVIAKTPNMSKVDDHLPPGECGIIVGRDTSGRGAVKVYKLDTNTIVVRSKFTIIPATAELIARMNAIADKDPPVEDADNPLDHDGTDDTPTLSVRDMLEGTIDSTNIPAPIVEK